MAFVSGIKRLSRKYVCLTEDRMETIIHHDPDANLQLIGVHLEPPISRFIIHNHPHNATNHTVQLHDVSSVNDILEADIL